MTFLPSLSSGEQVLHPALPSNTLSHLVTFPMYIAC